MLEPGAEKEWVAGVRVLENVVSANLSEPRAAQRVELDSIAKATSYPCGPHALQPVDRSRTLEDHLCSRWHLINLIIQSPLTQRGIIIDELRTVNRAGNDFAISSNQDSSR